MVTITPKFAVLIVDDNAVLASNLQHILETAGYITTLANNGQTAVTLCRNQVFNLALVDIQLPDMTGIKLVEKLNKLSPRMSHIIITGHASLDTALATVRHRNVIAYETKPLDLDHILFLIRQVAERWRVEEARLEGEMELATIFDSAPVVMILVDSERRVRRANRVAVQFSGRPAEEMIGLRGGEAFHCLYVQDDPRGCGFGPHCQDCKFRTAVLDTFSTEENYHQVEAEIVVAVEGGKMVLNLLLSTALLDLPEGSIALVCFEDITQLKRVEKEQKALTLAYQEQNKIIISANLELEAALTRAKRVEEALRGSEEKYRAIFTEARDGIVLTDSKTCHIADCNPEFESQTGRQLEQLKKMRIWEIMVSEKIASAKKIFFEIKGEGMGGSSDLEFQKPDGQVVPVEFITKRIKIKDRYYLQSIVKDITERKWAEEQLRHSQLLASLGEMTAGIAHEVNNPLGSILLYSELLMANNVPSPIKKDLKVIHDEAKRAAKIMTDLLTYGRRTKPQIRRLDLHGIIRKVLTMRRYQERVQNITVSTKLVDGPLYVEGDSSQLIQVFINLMLNAEEAIKESRGGKIIISTQIDGKWAKVSVADNGTGIPAEKLGQVFYPFFTTKPVGEGTGLGLSTCYGIVTAHSGLIHAENNETGGATFTVELPPLAEIKGKIVHSHKGEMARVLSPRLK